VEFIILLKHVAMICVSGVLESESTGNPQAESILKELMMDSVTANTSQHAIQTTCGLLASAAHR
jgi:hypothetical protein